MRRARRFRDIMGGIYLAEIYRRDVAVGRCVATAARYWLVSRRRGFIACTARRRKMRLLA